jgi:hypothetical protein
MKRVIDLTLKVVDGAATEGECRELERLTESDRQARDLHLELLEIEASLRTCAVEEAADRSLTEERTVQAVLAGVERAWMARPARQRFAARPIWAVVSLVAVAAAAAIALWPHSAVRRRSSAPAPFAFARNRTPRDLAGVSQAGWVAAPMRIRSSGIDGASRLQLDDDLALEVRGGAVVRAVERDPGGARRVVVDDGMVSVDALGNSAPSLVLVTPQAQVTVRAHRALLSVSADATRVDLHDGTATVRRLSDGRSVELEARQSVEVDDEAALAPRPLRAVLFVNGHQWGRHPTDLLDNALMRRLEGLGFAVNTVDELDLRAGHVAGSSLIVISPSVSQAMLAKIDELSLAAVEIPIICSRPSLFPAFSMAPAEQEFASNATRLLIIQSNHPLAAGFSGPLQVTRGPGPIGWGLPGPEAIRVAAFPDARKGDRAAVFAYDRGAVLVGGTQRAPARRIGFFLHPDIAPYITDAGWALLDAAVRWATADERP